MKTETIVYCVVALVLGMLLANMLKSVCGCKTVEGQNSAPRPPRQADITRDCFNNTDTNPPASTVVDGQRIANPSRLVQFWNDCAQTVDMGHGRGEWNTGDTYTRIIQSCKDPNANGDWPDWNTILPDECYCRDESCI